MSIGKGSEYDGRVGLLGNKADHTKGRKGSEYDGRVGLLGDKAIIQKLAWACRQKTFLGDLVCILWSMGTSTPERGVENH